MAQRAESRPAFRFSLAASARAQAQTWTLNACCMLKVIRQVTLRVFRKAWERQPRAVTPAVASVQERDCLERSEPRAPVVGGFSSLQSRVVRVESASRALYCLYSAPQTESYQRIPKPSHLVPQFLSPAGWISISEAQSASVSLWVEPDVEVRISAACLGTTYITV